MTQMVGRSPGLPQAAAALRSVYDVLCGAAAAHGGNCALMYLREADGSSVVCFTYEEFIGRLNRMARLFRQSGVDRSGVVSILSPNVPDALIAFFAAEAVGIANPINLLLRADDIDAMMRAVQSKVLITTGPEDSEAWGKVRGIRTRVRSLCHVYTTGVAGRDAIRLDDALAAQSDEPLPPTDRPGSEDVAAYFHTGGTTGLPKLAIHLHRNQVHTSAALAASW